MRIDILTLFPEMLEATLATSIIKRAQDGGQVEIHVHDIRAWADNKHRKVDHRPFGGGPGMVMMCQPLHDAVQEVERQSKDPALRIHFTPQGEVLKQERVEQLASEKHLLLIAGHYEGIDERVIETLDPLELSTGDYVLSGGEIPALLLVDAVVRLLPGVLGHADSAD
ncbi:MAG: tRNA (guanosine(37)-N1)-methyltransferase TrmD, partial [Planctomycetes bacterium]|nr:tRNA (guanosine(37)-N1)-methyltransferase TrmD [Planctomycetota bacterium]